ncbi:MAG: DMSO/TMAO reductase YedYZ heme-binding membrane subunit [Halioglobus sp.]|jgi:DMSO/TMAO reductase YedYZ heme-binding membrane subunit
MHQTGEWSVRMLLLSLLLSFANFYLGWSSVILLEERVERPYIAVGFGALLLIANVSSGPHFD